jgi:hypothetical protein
MAVKAGEKQAFRLRDESFAGEGLDPFFEHAEWPQVRAAASRQFRTTGFALGPSLVGNLDDVEGVLARVEDEPES